MKTTRIIYDPIRLIEAETKWLARKIAEHGKQPRTSKWHKIDKELRGRLNQVQRDLKKFQDQ